MFDNNESLLKRFEKFHQKQTRQIGRLFCIPASISNALRILGDKHFTQETIRDLYYAALNKSIETNIDDQMQGVSFGIMEQINKTEEFVNVYESELFHREGDTDPSETRKAEEAIQFIRSHNSAGHPVIASTWNLKLLDDGWQVRGFHMWLVLDFDEGKKVCTIHDSGDDSIREIPTSGISSLTINGKVVTMPGGLQGAITHSDYNCLALRRKSI